MNGVALRSISLCTGYGGIELGLELLGIRIEPICYVEIEAVAAARLVQAFADGRMAEAPIWSDVHTFPSGLFRGSVDIVTGGYPCQPFSAAGLRLGENDPRHLWPSIARTLSELRPRLAFFENVEGHLSLGFDQVVADLDSLGYRVAAGVFSASECGAPHQRKRLFILAELADADFAGPQGRHISGECGRELPLGSCRAELAFPHAPSDYDAWRWVLGQRPDLAPALAKDGHRIVVAARRLYTLVATGRNRRERRKASREAFERAVRGMADGTAGGVGDRTDHLRMLGNGVVPIQAAHAFATLYASLRTTEGSGEA